MKIMLDMDGVLTDYDSWLDYHSARKENGKTNWGKVAKIGASFWSNMPWNVEGHRLYNLILDYIKDKPTIELGISSAIFLKCGKIGKMYWIEHNCPDIPLKNVKIADNFTLDPIYEAKAYDYIMKYLGNDIKDKKVCFWCIGNTIPVREKIYGDAK